jgi:hypothetical protein
MSFSIANNNINITNAAGATIFDTDTPMPHITDWTLGKVVTYSYPDLINSQYTYGFWEPSQNSQECRWITEIDLNTGQSSQVYDCRTTLAKRNHRYMGPSDTTATAVVAQLSVGFEPDFFIVNGAIYRTSVTGASTDSPQQRDYGVLNSVGVPQATVSGGYFVLPGKVNMTGTTVLETAFTGQGEQWLTRTLTTRYVPGTSTTGGTIVADFAHSQGWWVSDDSMITRGTYDNPNSPPVYAWPAEDYGSDWYCVFDVYLGKFTI